MIIDLVYVLFLFPSHETRRKRWQQWGPGRMCQSRASRLVTVPSDGPQLSPKGRQSWCTGNRSTCLAQAKGTPVIRGPWIPISGLWVQARTLLGVLLQPRFQSFSPRRDKEGAPMSLTHLFNQNVLITFLVMTLDQTQVYTETHM